MGSGGPTVTGASRVPRLARTMLLVGPQTAETIADVPRDARMTASPVELLDNWLGILSVRGAVVDLDVCGSSHWLTRLRPVSFTRDSRVWSVHLAHSTPPRCAVRADLALI